MTRALGINLLLVGLAAAAGWAACMVVGWNPHPHDLLVTALAGLVAAGLALVPLRLAREATQAGVAQAALVATLVHLLVLVAVAGFCLMTRRAGPAFVYWLMAFYAATLVGVVAACLRAVRAAPVGHQTGHSAGAPQPPAR